MVFLLFKIIDDKMFKDSLKKSLKLTNTCVLSSSFIELYLYLSPYQTPNYHDHFIMGTGKLRQKILLKPIAWPLRNRWNNVLLKTSQMNFIVTHA
jgi:hypothetical protein